MVRSIPMLALTLAAALFAPLAPAGLAQGRSEGVKLSPEELFATWQKMSEGRRREAVEWFTAECDRSKEYRFQLERFVLDNWEGERFDHPAARETPAFDAAEHCPAQIIERRFVDPASPTMASTFKRLAKGRVEVEFVPAYLYDWSLGQVVSTGIAWDDPERIARNAVRGLGPKTDLVEALVASQLDNAPMADYAGAFGHAYSDRSGRAFREITLYDAWSSGTELEMPDVEVLGIIHTLDNDWKTWVAPVAPRHHSKLYAKVGEHYQRYHRYRALREGLARTYLSAEPALPRGYRAASERLHGFWEEHKSRPLDLAGDLPSSEAWQDWLENKAMTIEKQKEIVEGRRGRIHALQKSDRWVRRTFEGILRELGAFDPPQEDDANTGGGGN